MTPSALPYAGGFHIYLPHSFQEAAFWVYAIPSFITLGPWVGKPQKGHLYHLFFSNEDIMPFSRGVWETLKRPSGITPLLGVIASFQVFTTSYWSSFLYCLLLPPYNSVVTGKPLLSTQKNSSTLGTPGNILHLGTPEF